MLIHSLLLSCANDNNGVGGSSDCPPTHALVDEISDNPPSPEPADDNVDKPFFPFDEPFTSLFLTEYPYDPPAPVFNEASVHDPSVFRVGNTFYVIGSHMSMAKTENFMEWTQVSAYVSSFNRLAPNAEEEFKEAFEWAQTDTFWAGDIQHMPDGRFFMYYCNCEGSKPLGNIGLAISDHPEGPYLNQGIFLKSGMSGTSHDGSRYDATHHPNAVDPHAFFDSEEQFWMVYGSYSGGIYILRMDPETGLPEEGQGYGEKLLGGNHSRIEGPYIIYSPDTEYYYMFLTFGGFGHDGGYNIRVMRSEKPNGPYYDAAGNAMIDAMGPRGSFFADEYIEPFGTKIMGGFRFLGKDGERKKSYVSPGHNSAYYDAKSGRYFMFFHTRFTFGQGHEIRVHEMFLNENGWFVVSPFRFAGAGHRSFEPEQVPGSWRLINHGQSINPAPIESELYELNADGTITGFSDSSWALDENGFSFIITLEGTQYKGVMLNSWDENLDSWIMSFTALSEDGISLWGAAFP